MSARSGLHSQLVGEPGPAGSLRSGLRHAMLGLLSSALAVLPHLSAASDIPDAIPPFLSEGVPANLVLSVDDSRSMNLAFLPDSLPDPKSAQQTGMRNWFTSPDVNKLYYDPKRSYLPGRNADGSERADSNDFESVPPFPYSNPENCPNRDLVNAYQPVFGDSSDSCEFKTASDAPGGPAYYHRYIPGNEYRHNPSYGAGNGGQNDDPYLPCNGNVDAGCEPCGGEESNWPDNEPDATTPDECFVPVDPESTPPPGDPPFDKENFANWYTYYRTRLLVVKTVLSQVMQTLDEDVRLTWQGVSPLNQFQPGTAAFRALKERFDEYGAPAASAGEMSQRDAFYDWLERLVPPQSPPTYLVGAHIRAGEFLSQGKALLDDPDDASSSQCAVQCRNNFHLMLTDGGWEDVYDGDSWPTTASGDISWLETNQDGHGWSLSANRFGVTRYSPDDPLTTLYADNNTGMLADAVFYYWRRDLDGDSSNNFVPPLTPDREGNEADIFWNPKNDPATWQHVTFFAVGLGVDGAVQRVEDPETGEVVAPYGQYQLDGKKTLEKHGFPDCHLDPPYEQDGDALNECNAIGYTYRYEDVEVAPGIWLRWPTEILRAKAIPIEAKIDDLYHAGLNGRGGYFDASDPAALKDYFEEILDTISTADDTEAANAPVAISAGNLSDNSRIYQAVTNPTTWAGEVRALRVSLGFNAGPCTDKPRGTICEDPGSPYQTTNADQNGDGWPDSFPAWDSRRIFTMADGAATDFDDDVWGELSAAQQQALMGCAPYGKLTVPDCNDPNALDSTNPNRLLAEARIDWLRGEEDNSDYDFRERETPLGDILGSGPVVVEPPRQLFTDGDYETFRKLAKDRKTIVYVGANDGMLHAFNADATAPVLHEVFAYVPEAVYPHLADLTEPAYGEAGGVVKKSFVDGPLSYSDVQMGDSGNGADDWASVLVGAMGLGAQGVYALDVTDPDAEAEDIVLWEFTDASGSDDDDGALDGRDMGYTLGKPAIVRIEDGFGGDGPSWVVLVNNGYGNTETRIDEEPDACLPEDDDGYVAGNCTISQSGNAVLYVLDIAAADASRIKARMDTGWGMDEDPAGNGRTNGLAEVVTIDEDGDLVAERAYAGDLFGNVWRFDLTDTSEAPTRLFSAADDNNNPQQITTRIGVMSHPNGGYMLLFGTGKFINSSDKEDVETQTFYGIWDHDGSLTGAGADDIPTRADLLEHEFLDTVTVTDDSGAIVSKARISTREPVSRPAGDVRGWYIDLETDVSGCRGSERVVVNPQVRNGRVVFVSMMPESVCGSGGTSWINALDAIDGSRLETSPFDFNLDGNINTKDLFDVDDDDSTSGEAGSSIRVLTDNGTGIYSAPSQLGLGGGGIMSVVSDSEGDLIQLEESNAYGWRTWLQID